MPKQPLLLDGRAQIGRGEIGQISFHASISATSGPISTGPGALKSSACVYSKNNIFIRLAAECGLAAVRQPPDRETTTRPSHKLPISFHASFSATSGPISTGPGALESSACVCSNKIIVLMEWHTVGGRVWVGGRQSSSKTVQNQGFSAKNTRILTPPQL